jgi:hypothetical protein
MSTELSVVESAAIKFNEAKDMISNLANSCKTVVINDAGSLLYAKDLAKNAKKIEKFIEERKMEITRPIMDDKKKIDDLAKNLLSELQLAIKDLRDSILNFEREQEAIRLAELRRLEEERKKKEDELRAAMVNKTEVSQEDIQQLQVIKQQQAEAITMPSTSSISKVWTFEIMAHELIPLEYLMPDEAKIKAAIKSGVREIPGIAIFQKDQLTLR